MRSSSTSRTPSLPQQGARSGDGKRGTGDGTHRPGPHQSSRTDLAAQDLEALAGIATNLKVLKVDSAVGLLAAREIAAAPGVVQLSIGGVDMARNLGRDGSWEAILYARSLLVIACRAAEIEPPVDTVYTRLNELAALQSAAEEARRLGFFGQMAIHPRQVPVINEVFTPSERELDWARRVLAAFDSAGRSALQLSDGEFVDVPVALRARRLRQLAGART